WLQAFPIEARVVCAVQVGYRVAAADMVNRRVDTRDSIRSRYRAKVYLRVKATQVVVVASNQNPLTRKLDCIAITESQIAPGGIRVECWLTQRLGHNWFRRRSRHRCLLR